MQLNAYITINGSKPTRSMFTYAFEKAKVSDLCSFAAEKTFCPPGCSFKVALKSVVDPENPAYYTVAPDVDLQDKAEMFLTIDPPSGDPAAFQLPFAAPARSSCIPSQSSLPGGSSQSFLDTSMGYVSEAATSSTQQSMSSSSSAPTATALVMPGNPATDANFMDQLNAILATPAATSSSAQSTPSVPTQTALLAVYFAQPKEIEEAFVAMKPAEPVMISNVNVYDSFGYPVAKTALYVLKNGRLHGMEVHKAAKVACKKALVDMLVKAFPEYACSSNACKPATDYLAEATGNEWFLNLTTTDGTSLIVNAFRKRKDRFRDIQSPRNPATPAKRRKTVDPPAPESLDAAALALSRCNSVKETQKLLAATAKLRHSWIKAMESENALQIPETVMKKFPCFVSDASLLREDYKCNMQLRDLPPVQFGDALKKFIPAIFKLAATKKILPANAPDPSGTDGDAWLACKLLIGLVPVYCKRNKNCKPDRLFVEGWDITYINALHQVRRDMKQTAPMIFVITAYPSSEKKYLVATDDFALKVKGTFCDALQSLMELHYIFDLAYAKELKPVFLLLEKMANLGANRTSATLSDLYYDLLLYAESSDQENPPSSDPASSSQPASSDAPAEHVLTEDGPRAPVEENDTPDDEEPIVLND